MYKFKFADIGEGIHEGKLLKWEVKVGDKVEDGDTLFSVETDKINAEIPCPVDGTIAKLNYKEGDVIHVGDVVVVIDDGTGDSAPAPAPAKVEAPKETVEAIEEPDAGGVVGEIKVSNETLVLPKTAAPENTTKNGKVLATPAVRKLAASRGIDLNNINGSGYRGRIMKKDVANANVSTQSNTTFVPTNRSNGLEDKVVPLTSMRKAIAKAMTRSKTIIPEITLLKEVNMTNLVELRNKIKNEKKIKISFMPFIIRACTLAIEEFPVFNTKLDENKQAIVYSKNINIGMAADTPKGLVVPVIKNADQLSILGINSKVYEMAGKARSGKLTMADMSGGTFTITNYGSVGADYGTQVINYPETAIIGIGAFNNKPIYNTNGELEKATVMMISVSADHRVIDGADVGRFLLTVKNYLENPSMMLMKW